ncbi:MAG: hypothetical protein ACRCZP_07415 [Phycicoccus sp.]
MTRKAEATPAPEQAAPAATVRTQQYDAGTGWEVGQRAPADRYVSVGPDGLPTGKPSETPEPGEYASQVVVKGDVVTPLVRARLGLD